MENVEELLSELEGIYSITKNDKLIVLNKEKNSETNKASADDN